MELSARRLLQGSLPCTARDGRCGSWDSRRILPDRAPVFSTRHSFVRWVNKNTIQLNMLLCQWRSGGVQ